MTSCCNAPSCIDLKREDSRVVGQSQGWVGSALHTVVQRFNAFQGGAHKGATEMAVVRCFVIAEQWSTSVVATVAIRQCVPRRHLLCQ